MYEIFAKLLEERGVKASDVCKATGLRQSMISDWKSGRSVPKTDKLQIIADYFGVPLETFTSKKEPVVFHRHNDHSEEQSAKLAEQISAIVQEEVQRAYYDGYEAAEKAQEIFDDPDLRILMDAAKGLDAESIRALIEIAKRMKGTNPDG